MSIGKRVYILGAGASCAARLPAQSNLFEEIFSLDKDTLLKQVTSGLFDTKASNIIAQMNVVQEFTNFNHKRLHVAFFIGNSFLSQQDSSLIGIYSNEYEKIKDSKNSSSNDVMRHELEDKIFKVIRGYNLPLEDIFTLFDSIISSNEQFRSYTRTEIENIQQDFNYCIEYLLAYKEYFQANRNIYDDFAGYLVDTRKQVDIEDDNVSVITTNWDDLLDHALYDKCLENNNKDSSNRVRPDYCLYDYSFVEDESFIPSIHVKAKGIKNIKLLKLHGSINWLRCPACKRIFVDFKNTIAIHEQECRICSKHILPNSPILQGLIITPTFLKSLDEMHILNIWHNAFLELSEATEVIFIGYSFPYADFEMRCLLKKAVSPNTKISVILHNSDDVNQILNRLSTHKDLAEDLNLLRNKIDSPAQRYKSFFGEDNVSVYFDGFDKYLEEVKNYGAR